MSEGRASSAGKLLEELFLEERSDPSEEGVVEAARAISEDESLRGRFDRMALADRALGGNEDEPGDFERAFGRALFDARLDAMLAEEEADNVVPLRSPTPRETDHRQPPEERRPARPVAAWVSAAAVLVVSSFAYFGVQQLPEPEFQARTAAASDWTPRTESPRVIAFCVERSGGDVRFSGPDDAPFGVVSCPVDGELKLAIRNEGQPRSHVAFFGVHEDGSLEWYGPSPADPSPVSVEPAEGIVPVGETIRLNVNHHPGAVRIHALFTDEPVDFPALRQWVEGRGPVLFDHAMVVEPAVGDTDSQLFEIVEER